MSCSHCKNQGVWLDVVEVKSQFIRWGFIQGYTVWIFHGEKDMTATSQTSVQADHHPGMTDDRGGHASNHDDSITLDDISGEEDGDDNDGGFQ